MDIEKVGKAIAYLRKRAGYTQKELAERMGISDKAVSKWERGLGLPDIAYISKLAIILDTDVEALLAGDVVHHDKGWNGLLIIDRNLNGIGADTLIYDKPLVYYLISNFLLVGIKTIYIMSGEEDKRNIKSYFGDGSRIGIKLIYNSLLYKEMKNSIEFKMNCSNIMIIYGNPFIYGVDLTRVFQRAMSYKDQVTVLSTPRNYSINYEEACKSKNIIRKALIFNEDKQVVEACSEEKIISRHYYYPTPIIFSPKRVFYDIIVRESSEKVGINSLESFLKTTPLYVDTMNQGYFEIEIETPDDVIDASNFVKTIQKASGIKISCVEEIAWLRDLISRTDMEKYGLEIKNTGYGKYILSLCYDL